MATVKKDFWKNKPLEDMSDDEWESLCDGCGKCCLLKLQNEETGDVHYTYLTCKLLNTNTCRCSDYQNRKKKVPDCLMLRPLTPELLRILPDTCSYRLLYLGHELPRWHPLVTGDKNSTANAGMNIAGKVISETCVHPDDIENYLIE